MKIIDGFIFYNEVNMLLFRLKYLYDTIDYFIIVEATTTFSNSKKNMYFEDYKHLFKDYLDKIIHIVIDLPGSQNAWDNENYQRRCISKGIEKINLTDDDIIIISDCDEIPDKDVLNKIKKNEIIINNIFKLKQHLYYYNLNTYVSLWYHARIMPYSFYKIKPDCEYLRTGINPKKHIFCGWHFSYFGDINFIKNKIQNFSHQEYNKSNIVNDTNITKSIENKKDLFGRNLRFKHIKIENNSYLPENYKMLL